MIQGFTRISEWIGFYGRFQGIYSVKTRVITNDHNESFVYPDIELNRINPSISILVTLANIGSEKYLHGRREDTAPNKRYTV